MSPVPDSGRLLAHCPCIADPLSLAGVTVLPASKKVSVADDFEGKRAAEQPSSRARRLQAQRSAAAVLVCLQRAVGGSRTPVPAAPPSPSSTTTQTPTPASRSFTGVAGATTTATTAGRSV